MLDVETQAEAAFLWDGRRKRIEQDARETLRAISADEPLVVAPEELVAAAIRGIETSRYESLEILEASWVGSITVRPVEEARRHRARPG